MELARMPSQMQRQRKHNDALQLVLMVKYWIYDRKSFIYSINHTTKVYAFVHYILVNIVHTMSIAQTKQNE